MRALLPALALSLALLSPVASHAQEDTQAAPSSSEAASSKDARYEANLHAIVSDFFSKIIAIGLVAGFSELGSQRQEQELSNEMVRIARSPETLQKITAAMLPQARKIFDDKGAEQLSTFIKSSAGKKQIALLLSTLGKTTSKTAGDAPKFTKDEVRDIHAFEQSDGAKQLEAMSTSIKTPALQKVLYALVFDMMGIPADFVSKTLPGVVTMVNTGEVPPELAHDPIAKPLVDAYLRTSEASARYLDATQGFDFTEMINKDNLVSQENILDHRQTLKNFQQLTTSFGKEMADIHRVFQAHFIKNPGHSVGERFLQAKLQEGFQNGVVNTSKIIDLKLRLATTCEHIYDLSEANLGMTHTDNDQLVFDAPEAHRQYLELLGELRVETKKLIDLLATRNKTYANLRKSVKKLSDQLDAMQ